MEIKGYGAPIAEPATLRPLIARMEQEMSWLSRQATSEEDRTTRDELIASWARLVEMLVLGPVPLKRECPVCRHVGMREATRCGYCWTKLSPESVSAGPDALVVV